MDAVSNNGLNGLRNAYQNAARDSERLVRAFDSNSQEDPVDAAVSLQSDARQVEASAAVMRIANELSRYTLDIVA